MRWQSISGEVPENISADSPLVFFLTDNQKHLYGIYQRILTLCNEEKAISQGDFFDLMYANQNGWRFNEHKQYTFMRKYKNELLFIIVNFDSQLVDVAINVP